MSAQAISSHAYGDVPHRHPRWIVRVLDELFHLMKWVWGAFIFGGVGVGVVLALAEGGLSALQRWSLVQWIQANPLASAAIGGAILALLLALTIAGRIAHLRTAAFQRQELLPTVRVSKLQLSEFKLGANPSATYFERAVFERTCERLRQMARGADDAKYGKGSGDGRQGVMVFGLPLAGKTRLALEALRREAPTFHLLVWPHRAVAPPPWTLEHFRGQRVALLLDDLHEFANPTEAAAVLAAVEKLRRVCKRLVVVGTCRAGTDRDAVERDFAGLLQHLTPLDAEPMERDGAEADAFKSTMRAAGVELHLESFDGTPGSALLDLDRRTTQLRDPAFPRDALAILKALALLRAAQVYTYPERRVRRVAAAVFGQAATPGAWGDALDYLVRHGWVRLERADAAGESGLAVPADAYLDRCVAALYPRAGRRLADDFPALHEALSAPPADADALFALAEALGEDPLGDKAAQGELALACVRAGLAALDPARAPEEWARGHGTLGTAYADRIEGERAANLEAALAAFQRALTVRTPAAFPVDWAATQNNLGNAYRNRIEGERAANLEAALAAYQQALTVRTRAAFPVQWAMTTYNLALLYAYLGSEARRRGDLEGCRRYREKAVNTMRATLDVYTANGFPDHHADAVRQVARLEAMSCEDGTPGTGDDGV